jgi:hypothetical protein
VNQPPLESDEASVDTSTRKSRQLKHTPKDHCSPVMPVKANQNQQAVIYREVPR